MSEQLNREVNATKNIHIIRNIITLIGFITTIIFRLWGFSSFLCALIIYLLGGKPRQYVALIIADCVSAGILYFHKGFYTAFQNLMADLSVYAIICLLYWGLTLEKSDKA